MGNSASRGSGSSATGSGSGRKKRSSKSASGSGGGSQTAAASASSPARVLPVLREIRWLLYQGLVLMFAMGLGLRWVVMLARTVAFGMVQLNGLCMLLWHYLTSPYIVKRVRFSNIRVPPTRTDLAKVRHRRMNGQKQPAEARLPRGEDQLAAEVDGEAEPDEARRRAGGASSPSRPDHDVCLSDSGSSADSFGASSSDEDFDADGSRRLNESGGESPRSDSGGRGRRRGGSISREGSFAAEHRQSSSPASGTTADPADTSKWVPNNRAFLDVYCPVPIGEFMGLSGVPLVDALPPGAAANLFSPTSAAAAVPAFSTTADSTSLQLPPHLHPTGSFVHHKKRRHPHHPRHPDAVVADSQRPNRHASTSVGLHHAAEIVVPPTVVEPGSTPETTRVKFPVLILVTGGAWIIGSHFWMSMMARVMSACGFVCVTPDYRNFPAAYVQDMVDDVDAAIEWTVQNVSRFHGDVNRIYLLGQSAGAHLCSMSLVRQVNALAAQEARDEKRANGRVHRDGSAATIGAAMRQRVRYHPRDNIRAFVGLSGMYDFAGMSDYLHSRGLYKKVQRWMCAGDLRGCSALLAVRDASPAALAKFMPKKLLFAHGNCDNSAPPSESENMVNEFNRKFAIVVREAQEMYGSSFAQAGGLHPTVTLYKLLGATHTTPMVEDFISGRSEIASVLLTIARSDIADDEAATKTPRASSTASDPRSNHGTGSANRRTDHLGNSGNNNNNNFHNNNGFGGHSVPANDGGSFALGGTSASFTFNSLAALQAALQREAVPTTYHSHQQPSSNTPSPAKRAGGGGLTSLFSGGISPSAAAAPNNTRNGGAGEVVQLQPPTTLNTPSRRRPLVKFRPLEYRWQARLGSFVSAF